MGRTQGITALLIVPVEPPLLQEDVCFICEWVPCLAEDSNTDEHIIHPIDPFHELTILGTELGFKSSGDLIAFIW